MNKNSSRVLVVDDSPAFCKLIESGLSAHPQIHVLGTAPDPYVARDMVAELKPDLLTLDLEMPRMDGLTFLRKLMHYHPLPVIVLSSLTKKGSSLAFESLQCGAVAVISKAHKDFSVDEMFAELVHNILGAAETAPPRIAMDQGVLRGEAVPLTRTSQSVMAIGASAGGTVALEALLRRLPKSLPGTVICQHMPETMTELFARRLNDKCELEVREAVDGEPVLPGTVLIAPGGRHMELGRFGSQLKVEIRDGPKVSHHRPSVDVLMSSVARVAGSNATGVILTGMGRDGARGLKEMRDAGARTLVQDEATSMIFGMPKAAIDAGAAEEIVGLGRIPARICQLMETAG